jgi:class 3 adenylate cyclase/tetratricopeptide (TPR) repeat protein
MSGPPKIALSQGGAPALVQQSEHRQITVLMTDLVGFTAFVERAGEEAAFALVSEVSALTTAAIHRHRGTVKNFTGDGILALFGTPNALEDGPLRACRAALEIQRELVAARDRIEAQLGFRPELRISLTTGPVVLGAVDSGESTSVTAHGDIVNLAARLQVGAVPGTVVMSEAAFRQLEGLVDTELAGAFRFKGKSELQQVFRLVAVRDHATRFDGAIARGLTSYIGRGSELAILEGQLGELSSVRVVDIVGDPGIGKSRLLYEFVLRHGADHLLVLRGNCTADGQATPFLPFIEVLRNWFSLNSADSESMIVGKLDEGLKRLNCRSQQNLGLLLNLLGLNPPRGTLDELDGTLIGARTRDLLLTLIEKQSRLSTVILLLEDLHWIDSASEDLLLRIVDREPALSLIIFHTRRSEYGPVWAGRPGVVELRLAPLSSSDTLRIAQMRFGVDRLPESLARLIVDKAEGNALFVEEIASYLIERGAVSHTPSGLGYEESLIAAALPASVQLLLTARADQLSPQDRKLLQIASVIGRRFDPDLLAAIEPGLGDVKARLSGLEGLNFARQDPQSGDFEFKHVLMRDALYDGLLSSPRAELHLKVGTAIESRSARLSEVVETLAYHFSLSVRYDKAFRYCALSGRKCLDIYSLEEAERYFRKALDLLDLAPQCADDHAMATVAASLLEVLYLRGDLIALREVGEGYIPRLQCLGDTPELVFALYFHCMLLNHCCEFRAAEERARLAVDIAGRLSDVRARAYAQSALLFCSIILGRQTLEEAEAEGRRVLEVCAQCGDNYILNWAYWSIAWDYVCRGLTRKARPWALQLIDAGRQRQDNRALGMAFWTLAWIDIQDHRFRDAIANAKRCQRTAATPFDRNAGTMASATGLLLEGRVEEGLAQLLSLKKWALSHRWAYAASGVDFAAGPALAMTGRIGDGIRMLKAGISACDAAGSLAVASWNRLALAELYLGMLSARRAPSIKLILSNLPAIVKVKVTGNRQAKLLLEQIAQNSQIHEESTTRGWVEIDLAKLCFMRNRTSLARQHLGKARLAALAQESKPLSDEIDRLSAQLV